MKLSVDNHNFEGNLPEKRIAMTIKNSAEMFSLLSDGVYTDKILAVIREYVCNAYDAHVSVGKQDVPFTVRLPSYLDSTFSVSDEGTGVDPEKIGEIFWTYGQSSKTNDQLTIGALGIGCKSAFAYTKSSFIVKNRYQGNEYTYLCFINEQGEPEGSMVGEAPTEEKNGITVEFATRPEDQQAFYARFGRIFKHWANVKPNVIGVDAKNVFLLDPIKIIKGDQWYLESKNRHEQPTALAIMGNVAYPISSGSIPNLPVNLKLIADNPFVITFPLGDLRFTASRESLSYNEFTCKMVIKQLEAVRAELASSFDDKVFKASKDIISFYKTFYKTFSDLCSTLHVNDHRVNLNETFSRLLFDRSINDHVEFLGNKFLIDDLINCKYISEINNHQSFGLYSITEKKNRIHLDAVTTLTMTSTEELEYNQYYEATRDNKISIGKAIVKNTDWRSSYISPRKERLDMVDKVLSTIDKFKVLTVNKIKLDYFKKSLVFILNDVGSSGKARIKALQSYDHLSEAKLTDAQLIYVDFDPKVNDLKEVLKDLTSLINSTLTGTEIKLLSALPDARPTIKQVKVTKEQVKVKVMSFKHGHVININVGEEYFDYGQSIKLNIKRFDAQQPKEEILLINELSVKKAVPYVIKNGNNKHLYADVKLNISIINKSDLLIYSAYLGIFDELMVEVEQNGKDVKAMPVLVLTKALYEKLSKKDVKLISLNDWVTTKITAMNDQEKFMDSIQRFTVLSKVKHIKGMYYGLHAEKSLSLTTDWKVDKSLFKSLFVEYAKLKADLSKDVLTFVKLEIMKMVKHTNFNIVEKEAQKLSSQLTSQYQMLELVNYNSWYNTKPAKKIIAYIEQIDSLIEHAIAETVEEISHHEVVEA